MNKNIKLNVLIPTRERADTLFHSLRTVVTQNYENLSIIVSDNFSQDNTKAIVESFNDPRIKYLNTGKRISMSANWEVALSAVTDGWVTFLGDDDGLLPGSLKKVAQLLDTTKAQAIRSSTCTYFYPGVNQDKKWRLVVQANTGVEVRDANVWLAKALNGHADYPDLPMLYNGGFISHALLMESKGGDGKFFQSSIPDIYSAVACASIVEGYIYSKEPFAMFGNSKHSGGNSMFYGSKAQRDAVLKQFLSEGNIPFHPDLPVFPDGSYPLSFQAQLYESYLQTKHLRRQTPTHSHEQQLEVILARAGKYRPSVEEWGKLFAVKHGLDYDRILFKSKRKQDSIILTAIWKSLSSTMNTYRLTYEEFPINNIYDACLVASKILGTRTGRLENICRLPRVTIEFFRRQWNR